MKWFCRDIAGLFRADHLWQISVCVCCQTCRHAAANCLGRSGTGVRHRIVKGDRFSRRVSQPD